MLECYSIFYDDLNGFTMDMIRNGFRYNLSTDDYPIGKFSTDLDLFVEHVLKPFEFSKDDINGIKKMLEFGNDAASAKGMEYTNGISLSYNGFKLIKYTMKDPLTEFERKCMMGKDEYVRQLLLAKEAKLGKFDTNFENVYDLRISKDYEKINSYFAESLEDLVKVTHKTHKSNFHGISEIND